MNTFAELQLAEPLCRALNAQKYTTPTEIQAASIPHLLTGGDLLGSAQTGTGKTASFALPVLQKIIAIGKRPRSREVRALILTPTRELAVQVQDSFKRYGQFTKTSVAVIHGGVSYGPQIRALKGGLDVLVATPGRFIDHLESGQIDLSHLECLVLDEADRMLDMGFKKDLERIISEVPSDRQTIFFSATMPKEIQNLANRILNNPKHVNVSPPEMTAQNIEEQVIFVNSKDKNELLFEILKDKDIESSIVFTRTKYVADKLSKKLKGLGIQSEAIHGDKTQGARQKSLDKFKRGQVRILVATDVAARGIDVDGVTHVINYQLSNEPESYVHRIGRTARAGKSGVAITLCDQEESSFLAGVEKLLKRKLAINTEAPYFDEGIAKKHFNAGSSSGKRSGYRGRPGGGGGRGRGRGYANPRNSRGGGARRRAA